MKSGWLPGACDRTGVGSLEVIPSPTIDPEEGSARPDQQLELRAKRTDPEERPVDGQKSARKKSLRRNAS
jgi:hypothetical protein